MRPPWKHSLAALVVVALLGPSAGPSAGGDLPAGPGPGTKPAPASPPEKAPPTKQLGAEPKEFRESERSILDQLEHLPLERELLLQRQRKMEQVLQGYERTARASEPALAGWRQAMERLKKEIEDLDENKA